jgi:hypothetical protein
MQSSIFLVNDEPYCLWEFDLPARTAEFLKGLDPDYFEYCLNVHIAAEDEQRASVAIRTNLHHAVETLFSLIGAYVQAPDCPYAWIARCTNADLRAVVQRIGRSDSELFTKLNIAPVTWSSIAKAVFDRYMPGTERQTKTAEHFASLWTTFAHELIDQHHIDEYNALKHGFRVWRGGFGLAVGLEHEYGVAPPPEEMQLVGKSDFGATFFKLERIGIDRTNRSVRSRRTSMNWSIERLLLLSQLAYFSINNLVSALRIINGAPANECKFLRPQEDEDFAKPWQYSTGVTNMTIDDVVDESNTRAITKQELLTHINENRKS